MEKKYEGPGNVQACPGRCGVDIAVPDTANAMSRFGWGEICSGCGTREAMEGNFIKRLIRFA